ncbi:hypothetical protein DFJ73DRAFT_384656 [Zopfochytrium polystomum]|nr:hypothetical protein DFJ73DRAFT_384656 [Zopfochytrium polystomum]
MYRYELALNEADQSNQSSENCLPGMPHYSDRLHVLSLLQHASRLLAHHHAFASMSPTLRAAMAKNSTSSRKKKLPERRSGAMREDGSSDEATDTETAIFAKQVVVDEDTLVSKYVQEQKIAESSDQIFLEETLTGCSRNQKVIEITLELFYRESGFTFLQKEFHLFAVLTFLALFRLSPRGELPFYTLRTMLVTIASHHSSASDAPAKLAAWLAFLFDASHLVAIPITAETSAKPPLLTAAWSKVLDETYVRENMVVGLVRWAPEAKEVIDVLRERAEKGMIPKKSGKSATEPQPFVLTVPNPRKLPGPTIVLSTLKKARPIPKTFYSGSGEKEALQRIKAENRARVEKMHEEANRNQFKVLNRTSARPLVPSTTPPPLLKSIEHQACLKPTPKSEGRARRSATVLKPVKLTTTTILREDALVRKVRREEERRLDQVEWSLRDPEEFGTWQDGVRAKEESTQKLALSRRRLEIQLLHEEALQARKDKERDNHEVVDQVKQTKRQLRDQAEEARKELEEENRKKIEEVHEVKEYVAAARDRVVEENVRKAMDVALENQVLKEKRDREAEEELARKAELIQQIRLLERSIPPVGTAVRKLDLTETSQSGLLSEMSIMELQERLAVMHVRHREHEENKRHEILAHKSQRLSQMSEKLHEIDVERQERRLRRLGLSSALNTAPTVSVSVPAAAELESVVLDETEEEREARRRIEELQERLNAKKQARLREAAAKNRVNGATKRIIAVNGSTKVSTQHMEMPSRVDATADESSSSGRTKKRGTSRKEASSQQKGVMVLVGDGHAAETVSPIAKDVAELAEEALGRDQRTMEELRQMVCL